MNEIVITDSFIDYKGVSHTFTIAAIKKSLNTLDNCMAVTDGYMIGDVRACLKIGVSICNPSDKFEKKLGTIKALGRAEKSDPVLYTEFSGQLTEDLIRAYLKQEIEYIKENPGKYIHGYENAKHNYEEKKEMENIHSNLSDFKKVLVENIKKDPEYLNDVQQYIDFWKKHNK